MTKKNQQTRGKRYDIMEKGKIRQKSKERTTQRVVTVKVLNHIPTERSY